MGSAVPPGRLSRHVAARFPVQEPGKPSGGQPQVHAGWNRKCELTVLLFIARKAVLWAEYMRLSVRLVNSEVTLCLGLPLCTALGAELQFRNAPTPSLPSDASQAARCFLITDHTFKARGILTLIWPVLSRRSDLRAFLCRFLIQIPCLCLKFRQDSSVIRALFPRKQSGDSSPAPACLFLNNLTRRSC